MTYTFDGFGINDALDPYKRRLATLSPNLSEEDKVKHGRLMAAASDVLVTLQDIVKIGERFRVLALRHVGRSSELDVLSAGLEAVVDIARLQVASATGAHILYKTGDPGVPDAIKDRNGDVVLGLCKVCGRGEIELREPCRK